MPNKKLKIAVALSGGVDSSVAAAILKNKGHDVIGIFMHFWKENSELEKKYHEIGNKCCSLEAEEKARQVARILNIPFYVFHFEQEFKTYVVDNFIKEYEAGYTPNPCIVCNKNIKFDFLFKKIQSLGYRHLATGHYIINKKIRDNYYLYRAKDKNKDQSYFLYNIRKLQLKYLHFPVGRLLKSNVRKLAKQYNLPTAESRDSQGICFVLDKNINDFLKRYLKKYKPGKIVDTSGNVIGQHDGLPFYTIGQRRGIKIASKKPYYVADMDYNKNILLVTNEEKNISIFTKQLEFSEPNWLIDKIKFPQSVQAMIRYRHKPAKAIISKVKKEKFLLTFSVSQRAVMPGQSVVFYIKDRLIGGGIIRKKLN